MFVFNSDTDEFENFYYTLNMLKKDMSCKKNIA